MITISNIQSLLTLNVAPSNYGTLLGIHFGCTFGSKPSYSNWMSDVNPWMDLASSVAFGVSFIYKNSITIKHFKCHFKETFVISMSCFKATRGFIFELILLLKCLLLNSLILLWSTLLN